MARVDLSRDMELIGGYVIMGLQAGSVPLCIHLRCSSKTRL